jgi:hypothetical protein
MKPIPLTGGAYTSRGLIASAQRCVNMYAEANPDGSESPWTLLPTPGLTLLATPPVSGPARAIYVASTGQLFYVIKNKCYLVSSTWVFTEIGELSSRSGIVNIMDNGSTAVVVDGTPQGYTIDLTTNVFAAYGDASYLGSDFVDYVDTFLLFNQPNTKNFYSSLSNVTTLDSTYIAAKTAYPDKLQSLFVMDRQIWLVGSSTSEVWNNVGGTGFPFSIVPGVFFHKGTCAKYSVFHLGEQSCWLTQDNSGVRQVVVVQDYNMKTISNKAIETEFQNYSRVDDAVAWGYQRFGHTFYVINFPTADKTWAVDIESGEWHEFLWNDSNGMEHRHRGQVYALYNGLQLVGDWENGKLYKLDGDNYTNDGLPIVRRRGFPAFTDGEFMEFACFGLNVETGQAQGEDKYISMRWSDSRGHNWESPLVRSAGALGEYLTQVRWERTGSSYGRVFEIYHAINGRVALNGAYMEIV